MTRDESTTTALSNFVRHVDGNSYSILGILKGNEVKNKLSNETTSPKDKKFFCSELVAAALRAMGALSTAHVSSYFWPGDFAEGGTVERCLDDNCALGREIEVDCRVVEVGSAIGSSTRS